MLLSGCYPFLKPVLFEESSTLKELQRIWTLNSSFSSAISWLELLSPKRKTEKKAKTSETLCLFKLVYVLLYTLLEFFIFESTDGFHWSLSYSRSPQVSGTHLSILAVFNNAVVWMVSTRAPISKSSRLFKNPLVSPPKASVTVGTIVTFMFHIFFNSLEGLRYLSFFLLSFSFIMSSAGTAKSTILQVLFFFFVVNYHMVWSFGRD